MKKLIICLILIYSFLITGCPKASVEKVKKASGQVATYANEAVNFTRDLYRENVISLAQKDKIADALIKLAQGGIAFDALVKQYEAQYGNNAPSGVLQQIVNAFKSNLVNGFLDVLSALKVINPSEKLRQTIELIRTTVLLIASALRVKNDTQATLAGA
jgi:hypothetical protein